MKIKELRSAYLAAKEEYISNSIKKIEIDGYALKYVHHQTPEICLAAVNQYGLTLEYVHHQTEEICLAAVQQNGFAIQFVKSQTPAICLAAVQQNVHAFKFVDPEYQTEEICLYALKQDSSLFVHFDSYILSKLKL